MIETFEAHPTLATPARNRSCRHFSFPWCTPYVNVKLSGACAELKITYQLYRLSIRNPIRKVRIAEPLYLLLLTRQRGVSAIFCHIPMDLRRAFTPAMEPCFLDNDFEYDIYTQAAADISDKEKMAFSPTFTIGQKKKEFTKKKKKSVSFCAPTIVTIASCIRWVLDHNANTSKQGTMNKNAVFASDTLLTIRESVDLIDTSPMMRWGHGWPIKMMSRNNLCLLLVHAKMVFCLTARMQNQNWPFVDTQNVHTLEAFEEQCLLNSESILKREQKKKKKKKSQTSCHLSFVKKTLASNQALPAQDTSHAICCYWQRLLGKGPGVY